MKRNEDDETFPFEMKSVSSLTMMPNGQSERMVVIDITHSGPLDFSSP